MLRLAADENFSGDIVTRCPGQAFSDGGRNAKERSRNWGIVLPAIRVDTVASLFPRIGRTLP